MVPPTVGSYPAFATPYTRTRCRDSRIATAYHTSASQLGPAAVGLLNARRWQSASKRRVPIRPVLGSMPYPQMRATGTRTFACDTHIVSFRSPQEFECGIRAHTAE